MKRHLLWPIICLCLLLFPACGDTGIAQQNNVQTEETSAETTLPDGRSYLYEGEGFGGAFSITLYENGRFSYYEGFLSSHLGFGTWILEGDILILTEGDRAFRFLWCEDELHYLADGSHDFIYVRVPDGGVFRYLDPNRTGEGMGLPIYVSP